MLILPDLQSGFQASGMRLAQRDARQMLLGKDPSGL
jgi:hypothetical protein